MLVYYVLMALILGLGYLFCIRKPSKKKKIIYLAIVFGFMWLLATFRYDIGNDYDSYIHIAKNLNGLNDLRSLLLYGSGAKYYTLSPAMEPLGFLGTIKNVFAISTTAFEPGYVLLTKLITLITPSTVFMYGVYSLVILVPIAVFMYKYCDDVWFSAWLYFSLAFFYNNMNFVRQSMACSVFALGYGFLRKKKLLPYLLVVLLAASFHKTALIMIPMYFLVHIKLDKVKAAIYGVLVLVVFTTSDIILNIVYKFAFSGYEGSRFTENGFNGIFLVMPTMALVICIALFWTWRNRAPDAPMLLNIVILSSTFWLFSMRHMVLERFSMYAYLLVILAIPSAIRALWPTSELVAQRDELQKTVDSRKGKPDKPTTAKLNSLNEKVADHQKYYWSAVVAVVFITFMYNHYGMYVNEFHGVFPYQSVFGLK